MRTMLSGTSKRRLLWVCGASVLLCLLLYTVNLVWERFMIWDLNLFVSLDAAAARPRDVVSLDLSGQCLETIPNVVTQMVSIEDLVLRGNRIASIPTGLGRLPRLRHLDLSRNGLEEWPVELFALTNLHSLDLSENCLYEIPRALTNLRGLTSIDLRGNQIAQTNANLRAMSNSCILLDSGVLPRRDNVAP